MADEEKVKRLEAESVIEQMSHMGSDRQSSNMMSERSSVVNRREGYGNDERRSRRKTM